ncbi:MAG: tetratricopeptide repeat protein [Planctomycetota bacterium]
MQVGPYQILGEIARGGMGVVYRARRADGLEVALKLLHRVSDPRAQRRLAREVDALRRLTHPHVVRLLEAGSHQGLPWVALELVRGETLHTCLRQGPLPLQDAVRIGTQLAQAVDYVHACGLLHRDLKPDNVLLRGDDALLTDFGLVLDEALDGTRLTATGALQGTPGYWAPEQARGAKAEIGPATDVYGLGGVLYACLTGGPPQPQEVFNAGAFEPPPAPRSLRGEVPQWLSDLCLRCLAEDPAARPRPLDVLAALDQGSLEPTARGPAGAVVAGLVAVGALVGGVWILRAEQRPADRTPAARAPDAAPREATPPLAGPAEASPAPQEARSEALALCRRGEEELLAGRPAKALELSQRALELDPTCAEAWLNRGAFLGRMGRYEEALRSAVRATELDPTLVPGWGNRGLNLGRLGRHQEALECYGRGLELSPREAGLYFHRGLSRYRLRQLAEAEADFDRALELDPEHVDARMNRGVCRAALGRHREAIADYERVHAVAPQALDVILNLVRNYTEVGELQRALDYADLALERHPGNVIALGAQAELLASVGRSAEALVAYDGALEQDPTNVRWLCDRAMCKGNLERFDDALLDLDRALELDPDHVLSLSRRGVIRWKLDRLEGALVDLDRALELAPQLPAPIREARAEVAQELRDRGGS